MRRTTERARTFERRVRADRSSIAECRNRAQQRSIVIGERTLHNRVQIRVASAQKELFADPAFDRGFDTLGSIRLRVDRKFIRKVRLQDGRKLLLLRRRQVW